MGMAEYPFLQHSCQLLQTYLYICIQNKAEQILYTDTQLCCVQYFCMCFCLQFTVTRSVVQCNMICSFVQCDALFCVVWSLRSFVQQLPFVVSCSMYMCCMHYSQVQSTVVNFSTLQSIPFFDSYHRRAQQMNTYVQLRIWSYCCVVTQLITCKCVILHVCTCISMCIYVHTGKRFICTVEMSP